MEDLPRLAAALREIEDVSLVIIDPITAYLGDTDSHRNAEVRAVLAPLAELAAQHRAAILAISHLRKSAEGTPSSVCRGAWHSSRRRAPPIW